MTLEIKGFFGNLPRFIFVGGEDESIDTFLQVRQSGLGGSKIDHRKNCQNRLHLAGITGDIFLHKKIGEFPPLLFFASRQRGRCSSKFVSISSSLPPSPSFFLQQSEKFLIALYLFFSLPPPLLESTGQNNPFIPSPFFEKTFWNRFSVLLFFLFFPSFSLAGDRREGRH